MPDDSATRSLAHATAETPTQPKSPAHAPLDFQRYLPRTLKARTTLLIVVPMLIVQVTSTFLFYDNHWDALSRRMSATLAGDIAAIAAHVHDYPDDNDIAWIALAARESMELEISVEDGATLPPNSISEENAPDDALLAALWSALKRPFQVDMSARRADKMVVIDVQLDRGVLHVFAPRSRLFSSTTYVFVIWMVGSSLLLFGLATVFMHNQVRSIRRLAQNVDAFGKGRDVPDIAPTGAFEVRQAARAFNIMRARIRRQMLQRTEMLAGVSHDLRTPLTRMKLALGLGGGLAADDVTALKGDVAEMERMLEAYLSFARGDGAEEAVPSDVGEVLEALVAKYRRDGADVVLDTGKLPPKMRLKPIAFERCIGNLIGNAVRYGKHVAVEAAWRDTDVFVYVDDDGPGIPADKRDDVFRAFTRLEPSRNPKTGGVGLGLTIARDLALGMGGEVTLEESSLGGLRAAVRLPV